MATIRKRKRADGYRYTARVRLKGHDEDTRTFGSLAAARAWATERETGLRDGKYAPPRPGAGVLFRDVIEDFIKHRTLIRRPPRKTFHASLLRLKDQHGDEHLGSLTEDFWKEHTRDRLAKGTGGSTIASELTYAGTVLKWAAGEKHRVDDSGPAKARTAMQKDGVTVTSKQRTRRLTDAEIAALREWIDANAQRTHLPLRDLFEFALATGLRRGEILALEWENIAGRVMTIKRKHPRERDRVEEVPLLKPHEKWPQVDPLVIIERQPKGGRRVFPHLGDTLGFWSEKAFEGAGIKGAVFHLLRHECLSRLAERGFDPLRLALIGGHRDMRNVKRYAKLDAARLADE
jgi:integrase